MYGDWRQNTMNPARILIIQLGKYTHTHMINIFSEKFEVDLNCSINWLYMIEKC